MRAILAVLLLIALAFAGCTSKGGDDNKGGESSGTSTSTGSSSGTGTSGSKSSKSGSSTGSATGAPGGENHAPEARLTASTEGGALPLQVNFTLNGTDADGDALSWTISFGDGSANGTGTSFAPVAHNFTTAGTFNITLNVTDGKASDSASVTINVTAAGNTAGQVADLAWDVGFPHQAGQTSGSAYLNCEDGPNKTFNYDSFTMDVATRGLPFKVTIAAASGAASIQSWRVYFNLDDCSDFAGGPFTATGAAEITGTIPENASPFVFVMATGGTLLEATFQSGSQIA